jgi:hypothetical protein
MPIWLKQMKRHQGEKMESLYQQLLKGFLVLLLNLTPFFSQANSDDPSDWFVDTTKEYKAKIAKPNFVVPNKNLPLEVTLLPANNNLGLYRFGSKLFFAWRSSPLHFADTRTYINILSSNDLGSTWNFENKIHIGADVREPLFLEVNGQLFFYYFEGGKTPFEFTPKKVWMTHREGPRRWSEPRAVGEPGEVFWDIKKRNGRIYATTYIGSLYGNTQTETTVMLKTTEDGINWVTVDNKAYVYKGGVSEAGFEFDEDGNLWAVLRNEHGDKTGFGSHVAFAPANNLSSWQVAEKSHPFRFDSPKMFRHGKDLYLVARRDLGGAYDKGLTFLPLNWRRLLFLWDYWHQPKRTALYKIDRDRRAVVHVQDLPSAGDTAFPSIVRLKANEFLVANYTSPLQETGLSWFKGQIAEFGTGIYFINISFEPK